MNSSITPPKVEEKEKGLFSEWLDKRHKEDLSLIENITKANLLELQLNKVLKANSEALQEKSPNHSKR